jgi:hypothetical protein
MSAIYAFESENKTEGTVSYCDSPQSVPITIDYDGHSSCESQPHFLAPQVKALNVLLKKHELGMIEFDGGKRKCLSGVDM